MPYFTGINGEEGTIHFVASREKRACYSNTRDAAGFSGTSVGFCASLIVNEKLTLGQSLVETIFFLMPVSVLQFGPTISLGKRPCCILVHYTS